MARIPKVCFGCGLEGTVKVILYGMPAHDYDREKYLIGGCIPDDVVAECINCGWQKLKTKKVFEGVGVNRVTLWIPIRPFTQKTAKTSGSSLRIPDISHLEMTCTTRQ